MATTKERLMEVMAFMPGVGDVTARAMMGEYVLYYRGKVFGGIFDDRFLVKAVPAATERMPGASREIPYPGAKEMLLVDNVDDRDFLQELIPAIYDELPETKR